MANDDKSRSDPDGNFSFATRELRNAQASTRALAIDTGRGKSVGDKAGFDPYNTSGSFDRKKNWARVGKR